VPLDIKDMIVLNKDGVYEWKDKVWSEVFYTYFLQREDDDLSEDGPETVVLSS
jgi:hypothetical protein